MLHPQFDEPTCAIYNELLSARVASGNKLAALKLEEVKNNNA